ncbi:uncharacterized protein LOC128882777 [Hylaeus volcanicus]|uniref:uncharacterized protein LOC128882777 n=1 Tax=Hylaeus volcanicus TaxID=313075 RepID=UPI0023B80E7B|nr:uncharacterized protein LOC128882777 [Hylaeus volcanicus]
MANILNIGGEPIFDDSIAKIETRTYNPYANTTFEHNDEIRTHTTTIQQQDLYTLPCESFLYVEGRFRVKKPKEGLNVRITSTIKNFVSLTFDKSLILQNAGWITQSNIPIGYFNFCVPLNMLLGFCEDYRRIVINARHELILIRARSDNNCIVGDSTLEPVVELLKIQWRMPHVVLNDTNKLSLLRILESGQYLSMSFRSWDLYEYPLLQSTTKHSWAVKTAIQLEKPRYVIFALQTGRKNIMSEDASNFDACKLTNVQLYLNSDFYPYDDLNLDFDRNRYAILFYMYARFRKAYYGYDCYETLCNMDNFLLHGPFVVMDCSR